MNLLNLFLTNLLYLFLTPEQKQKQKQKQQMYNDLVTTLEIFKIHTKVQYDHEMTRERQQEFNEQIERIDRTLQRLREDFDKELQNNPMNALINKIKELKS